MAKKKKQQMEAWCWYCDREFEDEKVLLQHQKAKHYKCPFCPRRLNTAGGLTVHLHQVHKQEPTVIENALPGRESFDIEIYGMVGIPEADLAAWRAKKEAEGQGSSGQPSAKRQKIENVALTPEQLKAQLEAHKALMSGQALPPGAVLPPAGFGTATSPPPPRPPSAMPAYSGPPPGFGMTGPPPGYGRPLPPGMPPYSGPPPSLSSQPWQQPPPGQAPHQYTGPPPPNITIPVPSPHQRAIKEGAKSRMVYADQSLSPEEKMAMSSKYQYSDPDDPSQRQQQQQASTSTAPTAYGAGSPPPSTMHQPQQPYYGGPPPSIGNYAPGGSASPYGYTRPPPQSGYAVSPSSYPAAAAAVTPVYAGSASPSVPPPPFSSPPPHAAHQYGGPPPPIAYGNGSAQQAQSYPAVPPGASPPSSRPEENTAEALARTNAGVASADGQARGQREAEVRHMEAKAEGLGDRPSGDDQGEGQPGSGVMDAAEGNEALKAQDAQGGEKVKSTPGRRARAADLF